ncbi:cystathionine gamma-synthase, partial [Pseudomonas syringae pv. tagetis]
ALHRAPPLAIAGHGLTALQDPGNYGTRPAPNYDNDWLRIHADLYSLGAQAIALTAIAVLYGRSVLAYKPWGQASA